MEEGAVERLPILFGGGGREVVGRVHLYSLGREEAGREVETSPILSWGMVGRDVVGESGGYS